MLYKQDWWETLAMLATKKKKEKILVNMMLNQQE